MTNKEFKSTWQEYGVEVTAENGEKVIIPLKDRYAICLGEESGGLIFDTGGPQPGMCHIYKEENGDLIAINPDDPESTSKVGKLVKL